MDTDGMSGTAVCGQATLPPRGLIVRAGAGLAVVGATSSRVAEVAGATLVTLRALCVVLAALWGPQDSGHSRTPSAGILKENFYILGCDFLL